LSALLGHDVSRQRNGLVDKGLKFHEDQTLADDITMLLRKSVTKYLLTRRHIPETMMLY